MHSTVMEVKGLQKNKEGLKLSKAKQDLEKARELCKTMRSLRTKGESAKEILTRDTRERLHDVASGVASKEARYYPRIGTFPHPPVIFVVRANLVR